MCTLFECVLFDYNSNPPFFFLQSGKPHIWHITLHGLIFFPRCRMLISFTLTVVTGRKDRGHDATAATDKSGTSPKRFAQVYHLVRKRKRRHFHRPEQLQSTFISDWYLCLFCARPTKEGNFVSK